MVLLRRESHVGGELLERIRKLLFVLVDDARQQRRVAGSAVMNAVLREVPALVLRDLPCSAELDGYGEFAFDDRAGAWISKTDDSIRWFAPGQALGTLVGNSIGETQRRLEMPAHPWVFDPTQDALDLDDRLAHDAQDVLVDRLDPLARLAVALAQRLGDGEDHLLGFRHRPAQTKSDARDLDQLLPQTAQAVEEHAGIRRVVDVGGDHRRIGSDLASSHQLSFAEVGDDEAVDLGEHLVAEFMRELDERRGVGDALTVADSAEPAPRDRIGHFFNESFVAELVAKLEVHQAQVRRDRQAGATLGLAEAPHERLHEALVLEQDVHASQLFGELAQLLRQNAVPQVRRLGLELEHADILRRSDARRRITSRRGNQMRPSRTGSDFRTTFSGVTSYEQSGPWT